MAGRLSEGGYAPLVLPRPPTLGAPGEPVALLDPGDSDTLLGPGSVWYARRPECPLG